MEAKSGGLSKGCLIGIIIASVVLLLVIATIGFCWYNKDKIVRWGAVYSANEIKAEISRHPEMADTTRFNSFVDGFVSRLAADSLDDARIQNLAVLMQPLTTWGADKKLDTAEIQKISDAMIAFYPDLGSMRPIPLTEMAAPADSTTTPQTTDTASTK